MDKKIVTTCAACWTCLSREMALMLDYALNELISPPSLVCKKNSSHLHSLRVVFYLTVLTWEKIDANFATLQFLSHGNLKIKYSASPVNGQLIMSAKTNFFY